MKHLILCILLLITILNVHSIQAEEKPTVIETDWLQTEAGSRGETVGAEVAAVKHDSKQQLTVIDVIIPADQVESTNNVEIIGKKSQQAIQQAQDAEWIEDYEKGDYGLRLYLKRAPGFEFKIQLHNPD